MQTYRNSFFSARDYECTNVVACQSEAPPASHWIECAPDVLHGLQLICVEAGVVYYGYL